MIETQKTELEQALKEHKWYKSEKAGFNIGHKCSQLDFIETIMPTWGFHFRNKFCKNCKLILDKSLIH